MSHRWKDRAFESFDDKMRQRRDRLNRKRRALARKARQRAIAARREGREAE